MVQRTHSALVTRARRGDARAQFELGHLYLQGVDGLARNDSVALEWLLKAARQSYPDAARALVAAGSCETVLESPHRDELMALYGERAKSGDAIAQWAYLRLLDAQSNARDEDAPALLQSLALQGHRMAQWRLSQSQAQLGNLSQARYWAQRAAERGSTQALTWLSATPDQSADPLFVDQMSERFIRRLLLSDRALTPDALPLLFLYWRSGHGDSELRLQALDAAARAGLVQAQFERACTLISLEQVLRNRVRRADAHALSRLIDALQLPLLDAPQLARAVEWLERASDQQHRDASYVLGIVYRLTALAQRNVERSDASFERAARWGQADAQFWLGNKLWRERERNPARAVEGLAWLARAAAAGITEARAMLEEHVERASSVVGGPFTAVSEAAIARIAKSEPLLAIRIELAQCFGLSRLEALLIDPVAASVHDFLVVDLSAHTSRHKRRILAVDTPLQRQVLNAAVSRFQTARDNGTDEGDYRHRVYLCHRWLGPSAGGESASPAAPSKKQQRAR